MSLENLAYAGEKPVVSAEYKTVPADFQVTEELGFTPDGKGEHLYLFIEKTGLTTQEVQQQLAVYFQRPSVDVSFSGMKDKQAITRQWFSIRLPGGKHQALEKLESPQLSILQHVSNSRKLKRGSHRCNHFSIVLRKLSHDPHILVKNLELLQTRGVPNYFGEQRFGWQGSTLAGASQFFSDSSTDNGARVNPYQRSLYISAARAFLFNQVLSERINRDCWNSYLAGDVMQLDGTSATFMSDPEDDRLAQRLAEMDIHPTGPLWGAGSLQSQLDCAALENWVISNYPLFRNGLERIGASMQRRALRSKVKNLRYSLLEKDALQLEFSLNRGSYATAMLRELVNLNDSEVRQLKAAEEKTEQEIEERKVIEYH